MRNEEKQRMLFKLSLMTFTLLILQGCNPFGSSAEVSAPVGANNSSGGGSGGGSGSTNTAPTVGADQTETGTEDIAVTFTINAGSDVDGDALSYSVVTAPTNGTLANCLDQAGSDSSSDLTCTYTQTTANANGSPFDTFTYKVSDGTVDSETNATVTINLAAASEAFSKTWDFLTSGDYTYASNYVEVTAGAANLKTVDIKTDTESNFDAGIYYGTDYSGSRLTLANNGGCDATSTNCSELDASWTPQYSSIIGYWKFNESSWVTGQAGDVVDTIGNTHGTPRSGASITSSGKFSNAAVFDGDDDYIDLGTITAGDPLMLNGSDVTISVWVNPLAGDSWQRIIDKSDSGNSANGYGLYIHNDNTLQLAVDGNIYRGGYVSYGSWHHIVAVIQTSGYKLYVDGVEAEGTLDGGASYIQPSLDDTSMRIGSWNHSSGREYEGSMDELAIWSVALSDSEVKTIYGRQSAKYAGTYTSEVFNLGASGTITNFSWTPDLPYFKELASSTEAVANYVDLVDSSGASGDNDLNDNLILHLRMNESSWTADSADALDSSGLGNHFTVKGDAAINSNGKFASTGEFQGTNDYLVLSDDDDFDFASGFTISQWVKPSSTDVNERIFYRYDAASADGYFLSLNPTGSGIWVFAVLVSGAGSVAVTSDSPPTGNWQHIVGVREDDGTIKLYIDGKLQTVTGSQPGAIDSSGDIFIGVDWSISLDYTGLVDETAVWSRALAADEIRQLYQRGANRVKFQVRSCDDAACSGESWIGPDNSSSTYFTELLNCSSIASDACNGTVNNTLPFMLYSNFSATLAANQYFQYRAILESDDENTLCGGGASTCYPEIRNVSLQKRAGDVIGGAEQDWYWMGTTTVVNTTAQAFDSLTSLSITEGSSCTQRYQVSNDDGTTYYYYNGTSWATSSNETTHVSTKAQIEAGISSLAVGSGSFKFKTIFSSDGSQACSISNAGLVGTEP